jgi:pyrimidine-nucleoside phosphorylase
MLVRSLIARKRDGGRLEPAEWRELLRAYAAGDVPDYQMAALAMAVHFRGLDAEETGALTDAMLDSGARLHLDHLGRARLDKHSTGGVGDKVSLVLAPMIAALGIAVPMMSGRGLGHTGGTLDKLEAIPGFRTDLSLPEAIRQLERLGCVLIGQTAEIAPVDRKLYALRDATASAESIPLIAASIMSKKLAEGLTALVLDVKHGAGALIPELDRALALARTMIELGASRGCPTVALLTAMDRPLGRAVGNALEVEEAVLALRGEGPADLMVVTNALGAEMLLLAGAAPDHDTAHAMLRAVIDDGRAARKFREVIDAQGGNPGIVDDPAALPQAPRAVVLDAWRDGVVTSVAPRPVGEALVRLGGGRARMQDRIDPAVGFIITAKPGDAVTAGTPLATVHARDDASASTGLAALRASITIGDELGSPPLPLVSHRVTERGVEPCGGATP